MVDYKARARDANRKQVVNDMAKLVLGAQISNGFVDYSDLNADGSLDNANDIKAFFAAQGYDIPRAGDDRCFIYGYYNGLVLGTGAGFVNQFNGETTSSTGAEFFIVAQSEEVTRIMGTGSNPRYKYIAAGSHAAAGVFDGVSGWDSSGYWQYNYTNTSGMDKYLLDCSVITGQNSLITLLGVPSGFNVYNISD